MDTAIAQDPVVQKQLQETLANIDAKRDITALSEEQELEILDAITGLSDTLAPKLDRIIADVKSEFKTLNLKVDTANVGIMDVKTPA